MASLSVRQACAWTMLAGLLQSASPAADFQWANPVSGNWSDPALWTLLMRGAGGVPGAPGFEGANATINLSGPMNYEVLVDGGFVLDQLTISSAQAEVLLPSANSMDVEGLHLHAGRFTKEGSLIVNGPLPASFDLSPSALLEVWGDVEFSDIADVENGGKISIHLGGSLSPYPGQALVNKGELALPTDLPRPGERATEATIWGDLRNAAGGLVADSGYFTIVGSFLNDGDVQMTEGASLTAEVGVENNGSWAMENGSELASGTPWITNTGEMIVRGGASVRCGISSEGDLLLGDPTGPETNGPVDQALIEGDLVNEVSGSITVVGSAITQSVENQGALFLDTFSKLNSMGNIQNHGLILADGGSHLAPNHDIESTGTIFCRGPFDDVIETGSISIFGTSAPEASVDSLLQVGSFGAPAHVRAGSIAMGKGGELVVIEGSVLEVLPTEPPLPADRGAGFSGTFYLAGGIVYADETGRLAVTHLAYDGFQGGAYIYGTIVATGVVNFVGEPPGGSFTISMSGNDASFYADDWPNDATLLIDASEDNAFFDVAELDTNHGRVDVVKAPSNLVRFLPGIGENYGRLSTYEDSPAPPASTPRTASSGSDPLNVVVGLEENQGVVDIQTPSTIVGEFHFANTGVIMLGKDLVVATNSLFYSGGVIDGNGTTTLAAKSRGALWIQAGVISPGTEEAPFGDLGFSSADPIYFVDDDPLAADFHCDLTGGGLSDHLILTGIADFASLGEAGTTLRLRLAPGYEPAPGDRFTVMTWAGHVGEWGRVIVEGDMRGYGFLTLYYDDRLEVVVPPLCFGDANGDGEVNFADITKVLENWGASYPVTGPGDADGNGDVNFADITDVLENFGSTCPK